MSGTRRTEIADGTPRTAVVAALICVVSVVPSAVWRTAVGVGVPLGWSQEQLERQQIPGTGTAYVIALSVVSLGAALLTLGLVQRWGESVPAGVPRLGGRSLPAGPVTVIASVGALAVMGLCTMTVLNWSSVSGFSDNPRSAGALLMIVCYLPALAWGPSLLIVTWAYWRRRRRNDL